MKRILKYCLMIGLVVAGYGKASAGSGTGMWAGLPETLSPPAPDVTDVPEEFTVALMSYNAGAFRKYRDELGHFSYPEIAEIIRTVGPAVVGLNETDWGGLRTFGDHQASKLASALGKKWGSSFFPAAYQWYGNSIVWDKAVLGRGGKPERIVLEKTDGKEVRSVGIIEFPSFIFCETHLDHASETDRLSAVDKITAWAAARPVAKPIFLAGDMNARPDSETIARFRENWIQLTGDEFTYPSDEPDRCIDYFLIYRNGCEENVELLEAGRISPEDLPAVSKASDHCPVWIKILFHS